MTSDEPRAGQREAGPPVQPTGRGTLRVYLGAAPGVGKTYAMLHEGRRAAERGRDVVVGLVETHGRGLTEQAIGDLEVIPRQTITYRGTTLQEMDVDAILARRPERVLVDELAHTNVPGTRNPKRWQDVEELLDAGCDVITTLNIQHLESVNDVVERITGIRQRETVPDEVVRQAEQVELVDLTPEALRRRMAHGNIYPAGKIDASLANYFRTGNLAALRELALLWVADQVDVALEDYRQRHGITEPWETRERVVVALTGAPGTEALIRRAARIAQRAHGELLGVHVVSDEGLAGPPTGLLEQHRRLLADMGGEYHEVAGSDVAAALVDLARAENATTIVLGSSLRSRWAELLSGSVINRVVRQSGPIDVHVISHQRVDEPDDGPHRSRRRRRQRALPPRRRIAGWALALGGTLLLTFVLAQLRAEIGLPTVLLLFLALVVTTAAVGGRLPAVVAAIGAFLSSNWYFTPPYYEWTIAEEENVAALVVFLGVAVVVSHFVDSAARRAADAAQARSEARTLAGLAATVNQEDPLPRLLSHLRSAFGLTSASILRQGEPEDGGGRAWTVAAAVGEPVPQEPAEADVVEDLAPDVVLALVGPHLHAEDRVVLNAFAAQLATVLERTRLRSEAGRAHDLAEANELRAALLQAVSHDLRTPLASIKASVSSLRQPDVAWTAGETEEFLGTIEEETDRLTALVANLLDMSRIQAGVLHPRLGPVALEEVIPAAVRSLRLPPGQVDSAISESLPPVLADAALLERAFANVIGNAARFAPPDRPVRVEAGGMGEWIDVRVVDQGPGIPASQRERVFQPFQRLGDDTGGTGVGLGLAVARGFLHAMDATIEIEETAGGGTTVVIGMPVAT